MMNERNINKYTREFGKRLQLFREQRRWSRSTMAAKMGVSPSGYGKNENGLNLPSIDSLNRLAHDLNLSLDWLFFNRGPMFFAASELEDGLSAEGKRAAEAKAHASLGGYNREDVVEAGVKYLDCQKKMTDMDEFLEVMMAEPRIRHEVLLLFYKLKETSVTTT